MRYTGRVNRVNRRAQDAKSRKGADVSPRLLQKRLAEVEANYTQVRNVLFAIIREQGRVRFSKATLEMARDGDSLDCKDVGDSYVVQFVESNMVAPGGVVNGHGAQPKESA